MNKDLIRSSGCASPFASPNGPCAIRAVNKLRNSAALVTRFCCCIKMRSGMLNLTSDFRIKLVNGIAFCRDNCHNHDNQAVNDFYGSKIKVVSMRANKVREMIDKGFQLVTVGSDAIFIAQVAASVVNDLKKEALTGTGTSY